MHRRLALLFALILAALAATASAEGDRMPTLKEAAQLYHQGRFDSSLARLEALRSQCPCKRRDSLTLYQYQGMASARLGRDEAAVGFFIGLLGLDSLFQFPRNENAQVLETFALALDRKAIATAVRKRDSTAGTEGPTFVAMPAAEPPTRFPGLTRSAGNPSLGAGDDPFPGKPRDPNIGLALGAVPFGIGWLARNKVKHGLALGLLQAGGLALSMYSSHAQTVAEKDDFRIQAHEEGKLQAWQWTQRISLSTALGAYLFSLIASAGDR